MGKHEAFSQSPQVGLTNACIILTNAEWLAKGVYPDEERIGGY